MLTGILSVPLRRSPRPLLRSYGQNFGENNGLAKLTEDEVRQVRKLALDRTYSQRQIARMFGIKHGRTWRHLWQNDDHRKTVG
jgi:hypothetical protein